MTLPNKEQVPDRAEWVSEARAWLDPEADMGRDPMEAIDDMARRIVALVPDLEIALAEAALWRERAEEFEESLRACVAVLEMSERPQAPRTSAKYRALGRARALLASLPASPPPKETP